MVVFNSLLIIMAVAFAPSLIYIWWIRNTERYGREPWGRILILFVYGAIGSVILAVILEIIVSGQIAETYKLTITQDFEFTLSHELMLVVVVAPIVEEFTKGIFLPAAGKRATEVEDGLVYGAAIGLGFAATENLLYEVSALASAGVVGYILTAVIRTISSALLHASATSVTGLGWGKYKFGGSTFLVIIFYYIVAVLMHGTFNLIASFGTLLEPILGDFAALLGLGVAIFFAWTLIGYTRDKIRNLEKTHTPS